MHSRAQAVFPQVVACIVLCGLAAHGCARTPTSALINVDSDIGDSVQSIHVQVRNSSSAAAGEAKSFAKASYGEHFSFGVVPAGAHDSEFVVVATALSCEDCEPALAPESVLAEASVIGTFVPDKTITLSISLHAGSNTNCSTDSSACMAQAGAAGTEPGSNAGRSGANAPGAGVNGTPGTSGNSGGSGRTGAAGNAAHAGTTGNDSGHAAPPSSGISGGSGQGGHGGVEQAGTSGPLVPTGGKGLGDPCNAGSECTSTWCADGVCCQSECKDSCSACNLADHVGVCTPLDAGSVPLTGHTACSAEPESSCGKNGKCDGAGECELWRDVACAAASCNAGSNSVSAASKCDGAGTCVAPAAISCAPYTCDADGIACTTSCSASVPCATPAPCVSGSCGAKSNGSACTANTDCTSGYCVDGYCCDGGCTGQCEACNLTATLGKCTPVTSGQPRGARAACAGTAPCAGACSSASRQTCTFPAVSCRTQSCTGSMLTAAASCDGAGHCPSASSSACSGSLICNAGGTACLTGCGGNSDCSSAAPYCAAGSCTALRPNGTACTANNQCQNSRCVDGVCCNAACTGACEACDVAGAVGTCTALSSGAPHGARAACAGSGTCKGSCSAGNRAACTYPGGGVMCAAAACSDASTLASARFCDAAGGCAAATQTACASGSCSDAACAPTTCFVAGTLVDTAEGLRPIEQIRSGELVRSYDELSGVVSYQKVLARERRIAHSLVRLQLHSGATLTMSPEHQMWVEGTGWVRAGQLTLGDQLRSANAQAVGLWALETLGFEEPLSQGVEVFNLLVEHSPTYFVGSEPLLVHSCDYLNFSALDPADTPQ